MYPRIKHLLPLLISLLAVLPAASQDNPFSRFSYSLNPGDTILHFTQRFSINSGEIEAFDPLDNFFRHLQEIEDCDTTVHVHIIGHASIDGRDELNRRLSFQRATAVKDTITRYFNIPSSKMSITSTGEDWDLFMRLILNDTGVPARERVLSTITAPLSNEEKESKIRGYAEGRTWDYLNSRIFPEMRSVSVAWVLSKRALSPTPLYVAEEKTVEETLTDTYERPAESSVQFDTSRDWRHKFYIKTNVIGWAALMVNGAIEIDLARHWSFSAGAYWAGWNYVKPNIKFRNVTLVPEFRYWPKGDNTGFFLNIHGGASWFNVALGGDYRYQTIDSSHPALGGGIGLGWRFYFCRNHRWMMEAFLGGGYYHADYYKCTNDAASIFLTTRKRNFFCLDQIGLSFVYAIPL